MIRPLCIFLAVTIVSCGKTEILAPQAAEDRAEWEGVGIWTIPVETAPIASVEGEVLTGPQTPVRLGPWIWQVTGVERLDKGYARVWPSIDDYWVAIRLEIRPDSVWMDSSSFLPKTIVPREVLSMIDDHGERHYPNAVHRRLVPPIDQTVVVDAPGSQFTLIYALPRDRIPAGAEIHDPLGDSVIFWARPPEPSPWRTFDRPVEISDPLLKKAWNIRFLKTKYDDRNVLSALLELRNITDFALPTPDPAAARLYTGSGRTLYSDADPREGEVGSKERIELFINFADVPARQSLLLILPIGNREAAFSVQPDFPSERPVPISRIVGADGLRISAYDFSGSGASFRVRIGIVNYTDDILPFDGAISGFAANGIVQGTFDDPPKRLYPGYEERRWVSFPSEVNGATITVGTRKLELRW